MSAKFLTSFRVTGVIIMVTLLVLFYSCTEKKQLQLFRFTGETQGTYYAVTIIAEDSANLQPSIDSLLRRFDSSASVYKPNSIISRLNRNDSNAMADETFTAVFQKAMEVSEKTGGAFDITVGPLVSAWGFGLSERLKIDQHTVDSLLAFVGYHKVKLAEGKLDKEDPRIRIDYNAIAQGYAVDVLADFLASKGIKSYLVDIGGEIVGHGSRLDGTDWNVGIELPADNQDDERKIQAVVLLKNKALSTSGNYRKYYEENGVRYSHTIDPSTGYPVKHSLLSVSVLAKDCMTADAYSTAFMVMGLEKAKKFLESQNELEAYFIYSVNKGVNETFFTKGFESILVKDSDKK
ncbi:MAG: FAD:protein FMN transferase [Bacteroidales bacterium]|nr:FAD:protein FMN transferase [Bacteroidales bacterium]